MKIKHFAGYGTVEARRIAVRKAEGQPTLHVRVAGNHEWGIHREDEIDLFMWLVKRFDRTQKDWVDWHKLYPKIEVVDGYDNGVETCDYYFWY